MQRVEVVEAQVLHEAQKDSAAGQQGQGRAAEHVQGVRRLSSISCFAAVKCHLSVPGEAFSVSAASWAAASELRQASRGVSPAEESPESNWLWCLPGALLLLPGCAGGHLRLARRVRRSQQDCL